jgi:hypothetical protein
MATKTKLLAFHGKQEIKDKYVARVKAHAKADEIIKGAYWEEGKGCAVGCTIHSGSHEAYEEELGIPMILARLEDRIFEGMSNDKAMKFPLKFLSAIKVGADLSQVWNKFAIWLLKDVRKYVKGDKKAFDAVVDGYKRMIKGESISLDEWETIRDGAWSERTALGYIATGAASADAAYAADAGYIAADAAAAAYAADAAYAYAADADAAYAYAAAEAAAAYAYAAAYAADAAYASAAEAAARAYAAARADAAANAARRESFNKQAEKLLKLLKECE